MERVSSGSVGFSAIVCMLLAFTATPALCRQKSAADAAHRAAGPRVFVLNGNQLALTRQKLAADKENESYSKLLRDARNALSFHEVSVIDKDATPPSGDKHDYMSIAPYFWPDPTKPDGLPYVRRDGEVNPETRRFPDHGNLDKLINASSTLALAYYLQGDEVYAAKATQILRTWFLNKATRMNPNMNFAQAVRGKNQGRGIGLIETRRFTLVIDSIGMLEGSKSWTAADQKGMQEWFAQYLKWLTESSNGKDESKSQNNHGTYYDTQLISIALFTGQNALAEKVSQESLKKRITRQIEGDGRQPLELARTKGWGYSVMNLEGLFTLAALGRQSGVDLWNFQTTNGGSLRKALDWLIPFAVGEKKWPYQQIKEWSGEELLPLLRQGAAVYHDPKYLEAINKLAGANASDRDVLLYPETPSMK